MKRTLLLVDDDLDVREAFGDLFAHRGWSVAYAGDGLEALAWLAANPAPAVILLDLKMARCDGYEFRARQLADARWRHIPIVVFTADLSLDRADPPALAGAPLVRKSTAFAELNQLLERTAGKFASPAPVETPGTRA
jgi:CheY-like chemotaxis protein